MKRLKARNPGRLVCWVVGLLLAASAATANVILSDDFERTAGAAPPPAAFDWGANNSGLGGAVVQTYLAGGGTGAAWVTDVGALLPGDHVSIGQGNLRNRAAIVDYNLAADPLILGAGGFVVEAAFKPQQGVSGREWNSVVIRSNNAAAGTHFAIADDPSATATVAGMAIRNISSVLRVGHPQGVTQGPPVTTVEPILDQALFDGYVWGQALPNDNSYEIQIRLSSADWSATGLYTAAYYARIVGDPDWTPLGFTSGTWGTDDAAYVVFAATRGDAGTTYVESYFESFRIYAIPEPGSLSLLLLGAAALCRLRRRVTG